MFIEATEVTQPASAAVALQTLPTTPDHSPGVNNASLENLNGPLKPVDESVLPARTITKIASKPSKSRKRVTITANVISDIGATPTGTVMFKHGAKILWAEEPLSHGIASITLKMVEVRGAVSAIYSGDQHHTSSSSDVLVRVKKSNAMEAQTSSPTTQAQGSSLAPVPVDHQPLAITAGSPRALPQPLNQHEVCPVTRPTNRKVSPSANHGTARSTNHASVNTADVSDLESKTETELLATPLTYIDGNDGELTSCVAQAEDVERETALTGEITKLWSSHEWRKSSIRRSRTELEGLRYQLGERLSEYKSLLVRTGRNGKWMGFLREANIPRTTADRLVAKWQQPVKRTTGAFKAPSKAEIGRMAKKLALKLERVLTTSDSVTLFMTELAAALQPPESVL